MICKGRIIQIGLVTLILSLVAADALFANTSINVSSNTDGGKSTVDVKSSSNIEHSESSEFDSETNVKINVNGDEQEFHSTGEDVNYESEDGSVSVQIVNGGPKANSTPQRSVQTETIVIKEVEASVRILSEEEESQVLGEQDEKKEGNPETPSFTWINPDIIPFIIILD